jgi:formylmethanofuran dehydrogenase subunit E
MENDIHKLFVKAGELHGHYCPGLAIGVRAAWEALHILAVEDRQSLNLYCTLETNACFTDGIQSVFGTTLGKGHLSIRPTGKAAFSFYNDGNGTSVRLVVKKFGEDLTKQDRIERILSAPREEIFTIGDVRFPHPGKSERRRQLPCSLCGEMTEEDKLRIQNGKPVCLDCAGLFPD